ncbi:hypothetical protein RSOL_438380 [Rhizoctonia solani AG-3 Rhs1AP]|uniref:Uncharacterized protein n=2 Tax=Rhizoctonia solani AG-3 TaxID=1086053 RepID=A0A074S0V5_9AGAM|nr:hypothetical protein RSOL_438380 [Rhizoctonia solani AG-3 Rhs1AP]KEP51190.1 hypothetical protein V565_066030 [Rhizoctonia solani 123E]
MVPFVTSEPPHGLERVVDQPSEDFMNLKDPFASPTKAGFPLPPSPPRVTHRRRPRRRASEPLQLKRFGSFAVLAEDVKERQAGAEEDQHTQFLEELVRHAWFSAGRTDSDSLRNNGHQCGGPPSTPIQIEEDVFTAAPAGWSRGSITVDTTTPFISSCDASTPGTPISLGFSTPTRLSGAPYVVSTILAFIGSISVLAPTKGIHISIRIYSTFFTRKLGFRFIICITAANTHSRIIEAIFTTKCTRASTRQDPMLH